MQVVVVSNRPSRRTEFFCRAGAELGLSVHFMTYEELSERLSDMEDTVIKLEPVVSEESDFLRYARFDKDYREMLRMLGERPLSGSVRFLNTPASLLLAADKLRSKERMQDGGLRVTPLMGIPRSFDELKALLPAGQTVLFAGLVAIGLGCAPVYPCIIHETPANFGRSLSLAMTGIQMAFAYVGSCLMPPLFGLLAQYVSPALYPWYLGVLLVVMFVMAESLHRRTRDKRETVQAGE